MGMVLGKGLPLLAAIGTESKALLRAEWVNWKRQDNGVDDRNLKIHEIAFHLKFIFGIEIYVIVFASLLTTFVVGRLVSVELLNFAFDNELYGI
jgi:diacylglycerol kinase